MPPRKHSRRDFLKGAAARDALVPLASRQWNPEHAPDDWADAEAPLLRVSREAMAGHFEIFFNVGQYPQAADAAMAALDEVDRIERCLSYYQPDSQLSRVNRLASSEPVEVDRELFELLDWAVQIGRQTDGALDITSAPLSEVWGFARRQGKIPDPAARDAALARVGCDKLLLDHENQTVRFQVPEMRINLGAIGKGYAVDRCAAILQTWGINDCMVHGGQSSVLARGSIRSQTAPPSDRQPSGWSLGVHDPLRHGRRAAALHLLDQGLGTSGSEKQFFRHQGRRLSHVLDPRTGWPAEGLLSATVVAPTALLADALATALFVMGPDQAIVFAQSRDDLAVVLLLDEGNLAKTKTKIFSTGFSPGDLRILP